MKKYLLALTIALSSEATMTLNGQCYLKDQTYSKIRANGQCTMYNIDANHSRINGNNNLRNSNLTTVESFGSIDIFCTKINDLTHTGQAKIKESSIKTLNLRSKETNHITNCNIDLLIIELNKKDTATEVHIRKSNIGEVRYNKDDNIKIIYH